MFLPLSFSFPCPLSKHKEIKSFKEKEVVAFTGPWTEGDLQ